MYAHMCLLMVLRMKATSDCPLPRQPAVMTYQICAAASGMAVKASSDSEGESDDEADQVTPCGAILILEEIFPKFAPHAVHQAGKYHGG